MSNEQGRGRLDEALKWAAQLRAAQHTGDVGERVMALAHVVECLRAENAELHADLADMDERRKWAEGSTDSYVEACKRLEAENAELRERMSQLEAEANTARQQAEVFERALDAATRNVR